MADIITDALEAMETFFEDLFGSILYNNLNNMFGFIDSATGMIGLEVEKTPAEWNPAIFGVLGDIATNVLLPIGTIIITALFCYEIFHMVVNQNHMLHDGDIKFFFVILMKAVIAVYLLSNCWDITLAIFDVGSHIVSEVTGSYLGNSADSLGVWGANEFNLEIASMNVAELIGACLESVLINTALSIMAMLIMVILFGRMMEIYMYISIAPIPFATFINKEWATVGTNYVKNLCALAFQAFFIIICVVMFNVLVSNIAVTGLLQGMWDVLTYSVLLCIMLFKSGSISKSICNAH